MSDTIEVTHWTNYFRNFTKENINRFVKLEIFGELGAMEEVKQMPLAGIYVELTGANAPRIEILFGGLSAKASEHLTHTVANVETIMARAGSDNIETAVEFKSADGTKTLLSLETKTAESKTA
jgi:Family of unknown function (DUF5335)